jgi:DNA-binding response OmpR family regulator
MFGKLFPIFKPRVLQKHIKILVVDDTDVDMHVTCKAIEKGGYTALRAYSGKAGFEMAKAEKPHMIIMDYMLPDMKGPELCKLIKAHLDTHTIPVLFLTGITDPDHVIDCFEQGENYLAKPISVNLLLKYINGVLKDHVKEFVPQ